MAPVVKNNPVVLYLFNIVLLLVVSYVLWDFEWERSRGFVQPINQVLPLTARGVRGMANCLRGDTAGEPVDMVYTWVDSSDQDWGKLLNQLSGDYGLTVDRERYPSTDRSTDTELETSILSVGRFASWVRYIWIVTQSPQEPSFLRSPEFQQRHSDLLRKIRLVHHDVLFGDRFKDDLPTFNSHSIESHLHHIPGLSEHFIYLNDDLVFGNYAFVADFFAVDGSPLYRTELKHSLRPLIPDSNGFHNAWANAGFLLHAWPFLSRPWHTLLPLTKTIMTEIWDTWPTTLKETSSLQFRSLGGSQVPPVGLASLFALTRAKAYRLPSSWPLSFFGYGVGQSHPQNLRLPPATTTLCLNDNESESLSALSYVRDVLLLLPPNPSPISYSETVVIFTSCSLNEDRPTLDSFGVDMLLGHEVIVVCFHPMGSRHSSSTSLERVIEGVNEGKKLLPNDEAVPVKLITLELLATPENVTFIDTIKKKISNALFEDRKREAHGTVTLHPWKLPQPLIQERPAVSNEQGISINAIKDEQFDPELRKNLIFVSYLDNHGPWEEEWTDNWARNRAKNLVYQTVSAIAQETARSFTPFGKTAFAYFIERWCKFQQLEKNQALLADILRMLNVAVYPKYFSEDAIESFFVPGWRNECKKFGAK